MSKSRRTIPVSPAGADHGVEGLPTSVGFRLRRVQLAYKRQFATVAASSGFQIHDVGILSLIARNPGVTPSAIAAVLTLDPAQVTNILKGLEARGLVSKHKSAHDSRSRVFSLTDLGESEYQRAQQIIRQVEQSFVADVLDEGEAELLLSLLDKLGRLTKDPE